MNRRRLSILFIAILMALSTLTCASRGGGGIKENLSDTEMQVDAEWSAKDLRRVTRRMTRSIRSSRFVRSRKYRRAKPRWILARDMANDTDEHINTRVIMEKIRTQLFKSRRIPFRFIDDQALDEVLKQQSLQQSALFDSSKVAKIGRLVGAKLILRGRISNIRKRSGGANIVFYNITLQVVDIETSEIIWTDEDEISRRVGKSRFR